MRHAREKLQGAVFITTFTMNMGGTTKLQMILVDDKAGKDKIKNAALDDELRLEGWNK